MRTWGADRPILPDPEYLSRQDRHLPRDIPRDGVANVGRARPLFSVRNNLKTFDLPFCQVDQYSCHQDPLWLLYIYVEYLMSLDNEQSDESEILTMIRTTIEIPLVGANRERARGLLPSPRSTQGAIVEHGT
jgi:hypothetical protein